MSYNVDTKLYCKSGQCMKARVQ